MNEFVRERAVDLDGLGKIVRITLTRPPQRGLRALQECVSLFPAERVARDAVAARHTQAASIDEEGFSEQRVLEERGEILARMSFELRAGEHATAQIPDAIFAFSVISQALG